MEARAAHQFHRPDKEPATGAGALLTDDRREALRIAYLLNQLNAERQRRTRYAVEEAMELWTRIRTSRSS